MMWLIAMILFSWMLKFKPGFSLSSATFIRRLLIPLCFLPERWSHLHNWDYWYFSQQSWFQLVIHPTLYLAWCTPHISQICRVTINSLDTLLLQSNQFIVPGLVLTVASWPEYRFLRRQVRFSVILISLRIFQFVVIHTEFWVVMEAEVDVFMEFPCFLYDPRDIGNLIIVSLHFLNPAWKSYWFTYC